jgi:hypothetical protein
MSICSFTLRRTLSYAAVAIFVAPTALHAQTHVELIATALGHVSVVQVPELVENVALGSAQVHVEWHGNSVLIEPDKAGVDTNMVVFTQRTTYLYEITAAAAPDGMSWLLKESAPPPPPPPPPPADPGNVARDRVRTSMSILMNLRKIDASSVLDRLNKSRTVVISFDDVSEDATNYYVRLSATNKAKHVYRLQNPTVMQLDPAFGADLAYRKTYHQLGPKELETFRAYKKTPLVTHGSTLKITDMPPDSIMSWVVAITKPLVTPAIFMLTFPNDQGTSIDAVAIF